MKRKICVITGTRAEYGLLKPVIDEIKNNQSLKLQLIATGMHLSPEFGLTYKEIEKDGIKMRKLKSYSLQIRQLEFRKQWGLLLFRLRKFLKKLNRI